MCGNTKLSPTRVFRPTGCLRDMGKKGRDGCMHADDATQQT